MHKCRTTLLVLVSFLFVAGLGVAYSRVLPPVVSGDEYAVLLGVEAARDSQLPGRDLLLNYHYDTYLYPALLHGLIERWGMLAAREFLLFFFIFSVATASYYAFCLIGLRPLIAWIVALVSLMPRTSPGSTFFGVFTPLENMGRTLALPTIWLLAAWQIRRLSQGLSSWPVLLATGLLSYLHPVSMLFFGALLAICSSTISWQRSGARTGLRELLFSVLAYAVGAAPLLYEVLVRTSVIASATTVSGSEYAAALFFRIPWDFIPASFYWLRSVAVLSLFFCLIIVVAYRYLRRTVNQNSPLMTVCFWSLTLIIFSALFAFLLPNLQLLLIRHFDFPLILQQASRFFSFVYLGIFLMFGAALDYLWRTRRIKHWALGGVLVIGILSSSLGLEWGQYILGSDNYERYYIPASWQEKAFADDLAVYPQVCRYLESHSPGVVISRDFKLRYFCRSRLYVTFEEGGAYLNAGEVALVDWHKRFNHQQEVLNSGSLEQLQDLAGFLDAKSAVLSVDSVLTQAARQAGWQIETVSDHAIIQVQ